MVGRPLLVALLARSGVELHGVGRVGAVLASFPAATRATEASGALEVLVEVCSPSTAMPLDSRHFS